MVNCNFSNHSIGLGNAIAAAELAHGEGPGHLAKAAVPAAARAMIVGTMGCPVDPPGLCAHIEPIGANG